MKLSNAMKKAIEEMKSRSIVIAQDLRNLNCLRIEQKVTKNKTFEYHIFNFGKPMFKLFINRKFYKSYLYSKGVWSEEY